MASVLTIYRSQTVIEPCMYRDTTGCFKKRFTTLKTYINLFKVYVRQSQSQSYFTTDGQLVIMSWCRAPLWGP
jgi:hypothetical protein